MVNKSAKIFILGYNLNNLVINEKRGDYRGILFKIYNNLPFFFATLMLKKETVKPAITSAVRVSGEQDCKLNDVMP